MDRQGGAIAQFALARQGNVVSTRPARIDRALLMKFNQFEENAR